MGRETSKGGIMSSFITLEGGYLVIAAFILAITAFVTTRPFMEKGAFKKGMIIVSLFLAVAILAHFYVTTKRMSDVKEAFEAGKVVICESRATRKVAQTVLVDKSKNWRLEGDIFYSDEYSRGFHSARCIVDILNN
jgi:hypothetical protein